jgi:hypothetical protein
MLTIENTNKIVGLSFGPNLEWKVSKTWEESTYYHFILDRYNNNFKIDYTTKISIRRLHTAEMGMGGPLLYQFLYEGYNTSSWGSHLDFKTINFVLETFEVLVKRIKW